MSGAVELAEVPEAFERWLAGRSLADRSRREYARNVRVYCAWLAETPDRDGWQGDPLTDPLARDHAARDFRRYLQVEAQCSGRCHQAQSSPGRMPSLGRAGTSRSSSQPDPSQSGYPASSKTACR